MQSLGKQQSLQAGEMRVLEGDGCEIRDPFLMGKQESKRKSGPGRKERSTVSYKG